VFLVNSRLGLFSAAPLRSTREGLHGKGRPFSRSYGANLPSSLTRTHPSTLVLSHPPTCVGLRYGRTGLPSDGFSWERGLTRLALVSRGLPRASAEAYTLGRRNSNATTGLPHPVLSEDLIVPAR
jgi:hypothetical protein